MNKFEKNVAPDQVFYLSNGKVLNNLKELYHEMGQMPDDVFFHHVNTERNDFSTWVRDVMGEKALSAKITKAATPVMMKEVLRGLFPETVKTRKAVEKIAAPKKAVTAKKTTASKKPTGKQGGSKKV